MPPPFLVPKIDSADPHEGSAFGGTSVTISGESFALGCKVTFGSSAAVSVERRGPQRLIVLSPKGKEGTKVPIVVTNPNGNASNSVPFGYTSPIIPM